VLQVRLLGSKIGPSIRGKTKQRTQNSQLLILRAFCLKGSLWIIARRELLLLCLDPSLNPFLNAAVGTSFVESFQPLNLGLDLHFLSR